jgi:hypothetical protein
LAPRSDLRTSTTPLCYHLPEIRHYHETGGLRPLAELKETFYPKAVTVLLVSGRSVGTESAPRVVHALLGLFLVLSVGVIAARLGRPRAGFVAMLAFLAVREASYVFPSALVDMGFGFLQILTLTQTVRAAGRGDLRSAATAGFLGGLSVGAKLLGAGLVAIACVVVLLAHLGRRRPGRALLAAGLLGIAALVAYAPWFLRNARDLGEPLFPLRPAAIERLGESEGVVGETAIGRLDEIAPGYRIRERSLLVSLPALTFDPPPYRHPLNPVFLAFVPIGLLWLLVGGSADRRIPGLVGLALLAYAFWFKTYPHLRYALGPVGVLAVVAAAGFECMARGRRIVRIGATTVLAVLLGLGLWKPVVDTGFTWRHLLAGDSRETYLADRIRPYRFQQEVLRRAHGRVLSSDDRIYYLGPDAVACGFRQTFWPSEMTEPLFRRWLVAHRIDHVAVSSKSLWDGMRPACERLAEEGRLEVVFRGERGTLYRVVRR